MARSEKELTEPCTFRLMNVADIDEVVKIEESAFAIPWTAEAFNTEMTNNHFAKYVLIEVDGMIAGYCGMWMVVDEAHVTNIALLPEHRGKRLGEALLLKTMQLAMSHGAKTMTLEVRQSNHVAKKLYRKLGFQSGGIRKNYYADNHEDALVMWVNLNGK